MRRHLTISIVTIGCALLLWGARTTAQSPDFSFSTIDYPGAIETIAYGINPGGDVVGAYKDSSGNQHAFLLSGGNFNSFDAQIDGVTVIGTTARGINPAGEIVGTYTVGSGQAKIKGFLLSRGTFSTVLFQEHPGAIPQRITPDGDIYGCYHDYDDGINILTPSTMHGFVRTRRSSIGLDVPASMNNGATPSGNTIVGLYTVSGHTHGYVIDNGNFVPFDVPGGSLATSAWDINPEGNIVGAFRDSTNTQHGFLRTASGYTTINYPGAVKTAAWGINPHGAIVGQYTANDGSIHGFLALPAAK